MQGKLYTITNNINGKKYVGKTYGSLESRMSEHIRDSSRFVDRPLYRALNKYNHTNFTIELVGEFEEGSLELAEIELISNLDTFNSGYNATLGGDGKRYIKYSDAEVISSYNKEGSMTKAGTALGIDRTSVRRILLNNGIEPVKDTDKSYKHVRVYSPTLNKTFESLLDCAKYLVNIGVSTVSVKSTNSSLSRVCRGLRKSYKGVELQYI